MQAEYELKRGEMGDMLFIKEDGKEYPFRKAWGFCDGSDLYINSGDKYSKLIKRQNTFYFTGIKGLARQTNVDLLSSSFFNLATNTGRKYTTFSKKETYYKVDMETGEVY